MVCCDQFLPLHRWKEGNIIATRLAQRAFQRRAPPAIADYGKPCASAQTLSQRGQDQMQALPFADITSVNNRNKWLDRSGNGSITHADIQELVINSIGKIRKFLIWITA
ncbi:hypothetical protein D3C81_1212410 [compost metagenome]